MIRVLSSLLLSAVISCSLFAQVVLNEASSNNTTTLKNKDNEFVDWIELYNPTSNSQDLSTLFLTDRKDSLKLWSFGEVKLDANKHLLVYASGKNRPFTTSVEKTKNALTTNYYSYADNTDGSGLGGSTISPLLYTDILGVENGKNALSARINITNNPGLGYSYGGIFIQQGNWGSTNDFSDYNVLSITATISNGKTIQARVVQDGTNSWEGYKFDLKGTGIEKTYLLPLFKNAAGLDLTIITGIQFEANAPGTYDVKITNIQFESRAKVPALSTYNYAYADNGEGGKSTVLPNAFTTISKEVNGYNSVSAKYNYADNKPTLAYSYAIIQNKLFDWDDSLNLTEYDYLVITANIQTARNIRVALYQHGTQDHLAYGKTLLGTGKDSTYIIPLRGVASLDLSQIKSIAIEGMAPYGNTSFTIHKMELQKNVGLSEGHTNFKLSSSGETVYLTNGTTILDSLALPFLNKNNSFGRVGDGNAQLGIFESPTPNAPNTTTAYNGICNDTIVSNLTSGFYASNTAITLSGSTIIRYTLDGSDPSTTSTPYTAPIVLTATTVIKAACFTNNTLPKLTTTKTYIVNETTHLPVVSLITPPDNLFSDASGILVDGPNWTEENPHYGANYWEDWEIPVYFEFFDENKQLQLAQNIGVKVFGGWSRASDQKSLQLKADKDYGDKDFDYQFFKNKNITSFKSIVLRNSGNDFNNELFHDAINHVTLRDLDNNIDYLEYQPAVVFLNGEYWGIMNIREKINEQYIENNHGLDKDKVEIYDAWGQDVHNTNAVNDIWSLHEKATKTNMANAEAFNEVAQYIDLNNMIDYFAANIYTSNWDWPQNNLKFWRPTNGKFRYIYFDTDVTLGKYDLQKASFNQINRLMTDTKIGPHAEIFAAFMKNINFRNQFINRASDLMNTILNETNYNKVIDELKAGIALEVPKHSIKWPRYNTWDHDIQISRDFVADRDTYAWNQLKTQFKLPAIRTVSIASNNNDAGRVKLNSITPTLPWAGDYYESVPITLQAQAYAGYTFDYWETSKGNVTTNPFTTDLLKNETIKAHFSGSGLTVDLRLSEINYNSATELNYGDFVEIYNPTSSSIDLSEFQLKDDKDYHTYTFPKNTNLAPESYLVIAEMPAFITTKIPTATNVIGGFDFGFGSKGDSIRLFDNFGNKLVAMAYNNTAPWPLAADGFGYTLENTTLTQNDLSDGNTWISGCYGGSPTVAYTTNCATGFEDNIATNSILFPNPAMNTLHINSDQQYHYAIRSIDGLEVQKGTMTNEISIQQLATGSYIIILQNKETTLQYPFIKL